MDGPSGNYRPRTAGERAGSPNNGDGVRDWQRNTWYGPAPLNSNPFDEPEDAPELKEIRSENVNEHVGEFWAPHQPGGYRNLSAAQQVSQPAGTKAKEKQGKPRLLRLTICLFLALTAIFLILRFAVFTVRKIDVTGNQHISAEDVIRSSGIHIGDNILALNEKAVEQRILSDYRLQFRYLEKELPNRVVLCIREREACCWLSYCGIIYVMDKNRMVLFETENPAEQPANLVEVKGLEVRSNTLVGQYINLGNEAQQSIFTELFLEMKVLGCTDQIADADISNTSSILLTTRDGYTVRLGGRENLHAKIRSMLLVQAELIRLGYFGGSINVVNPEAPIYTP